MAAAAIAANAYAAAAQRLGQQAQTPKLPTGTGGDDTSFTHLLGQAMGSLAETGKAAETATVNATAGRSDMIDIVTAVAESETAMQTLVSVRDRVISAYQQIMQMPI